MYLYIQDNEEQIYLFDGALCLWNGQDQVHWKFAQTSDRPSKEGSIQFT